MNTTSNVPDHLRDRAWYTETSAYAFLVHASISSDGLLRTDEELIREIFDALPFERLGSRIRERPQTVVKALRH